MMFKILLFMNGIIVVGLVISNFLIWCKKKHENLYYIIVIVLFNVFVACVIKLFLAFMAIKW